MFNKPFNNVPFFSIDSKTENGCSKHIFCIDVCALFSQKLNGFQFTVFRGSM